ncbi:MAG: CpaF family protein [Actinomycetota bacterium]|nr:CpaF family protein [Actinomycetota bacterium]
MEKVSEIPVIPPKTRDALRAKVRKKLAHSGGKAVDIEEEIENMLVSLGYVLPAQAVSNLASEISDELFGLGPLESLMREESVSEIMVNGPKQIFVERDGKIERAEFLLGSNQQIIDLVRRVIHPLNLRFDETFPMVDARLEDGSRLNAVLPPLSLGGPTVNIRKFRPRPFSPDELVQNGTLSQALKDCLAKAVEDRANIIVSGGTSSGKTTMLGTLCALVPPNERIITIEDTAELRLDHPHVVSLESRPPNIEGKGEVTVRALVRNALRMRPDRIIVGEVRGEECLDMLQAMNTGHPGSLSTVHANSPRDLLARLETMALMSNINLDHDAAKRQIGSAVDLIVQMSRRPSGKRVVEKVCALSLASGDYLLENVYEISNGGGGHR